MMQFTHKGEGGDPGPPEAGSGIPHPSPLVGGKRIPMQLTAVPTPNSDRTYGDRSTPMEVMGQRDAAVDATLTRVARWVERGAPGAFNKGLRMVGTDTGAGIGGGEMSPSMVEPAGE